MSLYILARVPPPVRRGHLTPSVFSLARTTGLVFYIHMGARAVCVGSASAVIQLSLLLASAVQHLKSRVYVRGGARSTAPDDNFRTGLRLLRAWSGSNVCKKHMPTNALSELISVLGVLSQIVNNVVAQWNTNMLCHKQIFNS